MSLLEKIRKTVRVELIEHGNFPPAEADEIVDLACHAVERCMDIVPDVCSRGENDQIRMNALSVAFGAAIAVFTCAQENCAERMSGDGRYLGVVNVNLEAEA